MHKVDWNRCHQRAPDQVFRAPPEKGFLGEAAFVKGFKDKEFHREMTRDGVPGKRSYASKGLGVGKP